MKQKQKCALCGKQFDEHKRPVLDHDHETGLNRGFLCASCNMCLGGYELFRRERLLERVENYIATGGPACGRRSSQPQRRFRRLAFHLMTAEASEHHPEPPGDTPDDE